MKLVSSTLVANLGLTSISKKTNQFLLTSNSVVTVSILKTGTPSKDATPIDSLFSGVIIHQSGLILTTSNAVDKTATIQVKFKNGLCLAAELAQSLPEAHLALIRLKQIPTSLSVAKIGDVTSTTIGQQIRLIDASTNTAYQSHFAEVTGKFMRATYTCGKMVEFIQAETKIPFKNRNPILFNKKGEVIGIGNSNLVIEGNGKMSAGVSISTAMEMFF